MPSREDPVGGGSEDLSWQRNLEYQARRTVTLESHCEVLTSHEEVSRWKGEGEVVPYLYYSWLSAGVKSVCIHAPGDHHSISG
jgi:hypothetical protein